ncbi:hypothetical protein DL991_12790 [Amycolatopsis sp. WAC 01375]|uniref:hypothetical protein n=1 Tax=unclassified Amycolatopsis TaxID=2618356 RepID=UPI000F7B05FA|nr:MULTISPECIES: hypothetical protein [unclassified Amycolatopsis]RSM79682.1 hypothetical protein DL991_12790 [Amycolatopsis sp. WAC 01375]RSN27479.1 hypothetical protein DL990_30340 [Amycolatopsis sp. WAC 01416]
MSQGFAVDPELVKHAAQRASEAVTHFETHGTAVKNAQAVIERNSALLGDYGDAGVFFHACEDFSNKFKETFDTLISYNDSFVDTARRLQGGLQTASKLYAETETAAGERLRRIGEPWMDGGR